MISVLRLQKLKLTQKFLTVFCNNRQLQRSAAPFSARIATRKVGGNIVGVHAYHALHAMPFPAMAVFPHFNIQLVRQTISIFVCCVK